MTPEEIKRFNFLEAAARVYLAYTTQEPQKCVKHRAPEWRKGEDPHAFLVQYRRGDHHVAAFYSEKAITFRSLTTRKQINSVLIRKVLEYIEKERLAFEYPALLLSGKFKPTIRVRKVHASVSAHRRSSKASNTQTK